MKRLNLNNMVNLKKYSVICPVMKENIPQKNLYVIDSWEEV